jgi:hypothetical protein
MRVIGTARPKTIDPLQEMINSNLSLPFPFKRKLIISFKGFSKAEKSFSLLGYAPIGRLKK